MLKISRMLLSFIAVAGMVFAGPLLARTADGIKALKEEVATLRDGQETMQGDLDEIKKLLQQGARPAAPSAKTFTPRTIEPGDNHYRGQQGNHRGMHDAQIGSDIAEGRALGVSGTPSFVVGLTDPEDPGSVSVTQPRSDHPGAYRPPAGNHPGFFSFEWPPTRFSVR